MSQLIDDLLAFSRIGRTAMRKVPVDLNALVRAVIGELQPDIRSRNVEWTSQNEGATFYFSLPAPNKAECAMAAPLALKEQWVENAPPGPKDA